MTAADPIIDAPIIWQPTPGQVADCQMTAFLQEVNRTHGVGLDDYPALWQWSVDQPALFWSMLWKYCNVIASAPPTSGLPSGANTRLLVAPRGS